MSDDDEKIQIERRVLALVRSLNDIPGVVTFTSCGGHPKPAKESHAPDGEFFVAFEVEPTARGWAALQRIAWGVAGASDATDSGWIELTACWMGGEDESSPAPGKGPRPRWLVAQTMKAEAESRRTDQSRLAFEVRGWNGADPDRLAELLDASDFPRDAANEATSIHRSQADRALAPP